MRIYPGDLIRIRRGNCGEGRVLRLNKYYINSLGNTVVEAEEPHNSNIVVYERLEDITLHTACSPLRKGR